jgi:ABC-type transporter Mla subunit MlaD
MKSVIDPCGADVRFDANDCQTDGALLSAAIMTEQPSFMSRIAGWFRWNRSDDSLPLEKETFALEVKTPARRGWFFQRDSRRDAAMESLQRGFDDLTRLITSIRDNMDQQTRRQDELLSFVSQLPELLETLPESLRTQGETLRAIVTQLQQQMEHQARLGQVLGQLADADADHHQRIGAMDQRLEAMTMQSQTISATLRQVGASLDSAGRASEATAETIRQIQEKISTRDEQLESVLRTQNTRFTTMIAAAIAIAIAALGCTAWVGWMLMNK